MGKAVFVPYRLYPFLKAVNCEVGHAVEDDDNSQTGARKEGAFVRVLGGEAVFPKPIFYRVFARVSREKRFSGPVYPL